MRLMETSDREKAVRYMAKLAGVELDFLGRNALRESYKKKKGLPFKENTLSYIREIKNAKGNGGCIYSESQIREWHEKLLRSRYAMEYLIEKRKLTERDIEKFYLGYDVREEDIIFPVYSLGPVGCSRLKAVVRRTLSEEKAEYFGKYKIFGAKNECLYGLNEAEGVELDLNHLILVEGVFDAIALQRIGYSAVAVMGTSITKYQMKILYELLPREISLCFDCDSKIKKEDAGKNGMLRMISQFSKAGFNLDNISVIQISGYQDPDEVPEREFRKMYENRISAIDFYLTQQIR